MAQAARTLAVKPAAFVGSQAEKHLLDSHV
jgi:hypothetical protein